MSKDTISGFECPECGREWHPLDGKRLEFMNTHRELHDVVIAAEDFYVE